MTEIILTVSHLFKVPPDDLLSKKRKMPRPEARHRVFGLCYQTGWKQTQIAKHFNLSQSAISQGITHYFQKSRQ